MSADSRQTFQANDSTELARPGPNLLGFSLCQGSGHREMNKQTNQQIKVISDSDKSYQESKAAKCEVDRRLEQVRVIQGG